ncbi:hypothetical protein [Phenylobacterium sp.]|uniref:hypothetical protein n=1 Tax=Phenylobacterium sp. TaxID=1871053 RepID=UPI0027192DEE|nr:hypothetical protein [Phenylobacterium sp.]MDO8380135.1 hypothetical protein [Phenylobacterium sp.]
MDPISNVDQLVLLLRQRLLERSKSHGVTARRRSSSEQPASPLENVQALAGVDGVEERQLRRAFIQSILVDQLDARLINDAKFQQVVDRVTDALDDDAGSSRLLTRLVGELRASAR